MRGEDITCAPYVASLRIFEPLSAFEPVDRLRWSEIDASIDSRRAEQELALRRLVFPESPAGRPDGAHVLDIDEIRYVSPWSTATRCWDALDEFKDSLPSSITPAQPVHWLKGREWFENTK